MFIYSTDRCGATNPMAAQLTATAKPRMSPATFLAKPTKRNCSPDSITEVATKRMSSEPTSAATTGDYKRKFSAIKQQYKY